MFATNNPFFRQAPRIPDTAKVVFVADMFVEDYPLGGAELTSEALIQSAPFEVFKLHSKDVSMELLEQGADRFWVFGNFANMNHDLIPTIIANMRYAVLEYDYKYCRYRSPEKHMEVEQTPCTCSNEINGKMVSAFFCGAKSLWWMSERQMDRYHTMFPGLEDVDNTVLSSVFDDSFFLAVKVLREQRAKQPRKGWIVLGSPSWVKGQDAAERWCKENGKDFEVVWGLPYGKVLEKLASAEGFVYLPAGGDTCPRMVIEAKLLGCQLYLNDNVQHKDEEWFATDDLLDTESYLFAARDRFWNGIRANMEHRPRISGYTTTYNCVRQKYPFVDSIMSMLGFCDEVCVVDGGSTDETIDHLADIAYSTDDAVKAMQTAEDIKCMIALARASGEHCYEFPDTIIDAQKDPRVKVKVIFRDWSAPNFAVFDGEQKAEARRMCTGDFCWQMDSDEVVHESDFSKIRDLVANFPRGLDMLALPVIEYWGSTDKVRADINPWKWRVSRNNPRITHGIPAELRKVGSDGLPRALPGTDGCDPIDAVTGERVQFGTFMTPDVNHVRQMIFDANTPDNVRSNALERYGVWFDFVVGNYPSVFHFSWLDIGRKMRLYRDYWTKHWESLTDGDISDTAETNMMFDAPWSQVTEEMIDARAKELAERCGGWVWHSKWRGEQTPHITCTRQPPRVRML